MSKELTDFSDQVEQLFDQDQAEPRDFWELLFRLLFKSDQTDNVH